MKEYILCEFLVEIDAVSLVEFLYNLGDDFIITGTDLEFEVEDGQGTSWMRISGKINTEFATMLKLQNADLANRMRISYIPDELKDKYRTGNR